jgi:hypothetical protein
MSGGPEFLHPESGKLLIFLGDTGKIMNTDRYVAGISMEFGTEG